MIEYIKIERFKSIKKMELELKSINILIGGNGAGKSNFIAFFKMLSEIFNNRLQRYVIEENPENILYYGSKTSEKILGEIAMKDIEERGFKYSFELGQTNEGGLYIIHELGGYSIKYGDIRLYSEAYKKESSFANPIHPAYKEIQNYISSIRIFHFHDTSSTSYLRRKCDIDDNHYLRSDGRNLPAFLYLLKVKHPKIYSRILKTIQSVAPYIHEFILEPNELNKKEIELRWVDKGDPESSFSAYQFSDGTLRFIALTTLLLQPAPPSVIIIDEPELGLHPFAIGKLAGMIQVASGKAQIIAATQSPGLVSCFSPEDILVIDRSEKENQSIFNRLDEKRMSIWLQDETNTLGQLWERNIINAAQPFAK